MLGYLKSLFQLSLSPARGWEDIAADSVDPRELASHGLYPLIALAAASEFLALIYDSEATIVSTLQQAIATFIIYFVGYFIGAWALSMALPSMAYKTVSERKILTFANYSSGLLTVIAIAANAIHGLVTLIYFLPIYVMIIQWKGMRYLCVDEPETWKFILLMICGLILPPYLLGMLFHLIIPS